MPGKGQETLRNLDDDLIYIVCYGVFLSFVCIYDLLIIEEAVKSLSCIGLINNNKKGTKRDLKDHL